MKNEWNEKREKKINKRWKYIHKNKKNKNKVKKRLNQEKKDLKCAYFGVIDIIHIHII